jgi:diguanylate cyclase (GGDEF)-like protein/PAS domain S-box-containing protein/excisionase family DNA binding protein
MDPGRLAAIVAESDDAIISVDAEGTIIGWGAGAERLFGYAEADAIGSGIEIIVPPGGTAEARSALRRALEGELIGTFTSEGCSRDGELLQVAVTVWPTADAEGDITGAAAVVRRIDGRTGPSAPGDVELGQRAVLVRLAHSALRDVDLRELIAGACSLAAAELGVEHAAVLRTPLADDNERSLPAAAGSISVPIGPRDEEPYGVFEVLTRTPRSFTRKEISFVEVVATILAGAFRREALEEEIRRRALHDELTGLGNVTRFLDRLEHALTRVAADRSRLAVLVLGLPRFTVVTGSLGAAAGDELLRLVATRLRNAVSSDVTVARVDGDEFAVLCERCGSERDAITVAERLIEACAEPFAVGDGRFSASPSIGIVLADGRSQDAEVLLRDAEAAMREGKQRGLPGYHLFDPQLRARMADSLDIEEGLRRALEQDQLRLYYQPVIDLRSGEVAALEALLRWERPEYGLWLPDQFLPVAEASGLIGPIGHWVLENACRDMARWSPLGSGGSVPLVSINASVGAVRDRRFAQDLAAAASKAGVEPSQLVLELTENALTDPTRSPREILEEVRALGTAVWLDDFGTGSSSLSYLQRFELDALKIDRSFVAGISEERNQRIVEAVLAMGRALGLQVVAEGVETVEQLSYLRDLGCRAAQGNLFARPLHAAGVPDLLESGIDPALRALMLEPPAVQGEVSAPSSANPVDSLAIGEAAQALGVSVSTLRRWADSGQVATVRTAGGHRRFPTQEIRQLAGRSARLRAVSIRAAEPPAGPLPKLALLLRSEAATVAETVGRGIYQDKRELGWFASDEGADASTRWLRALALAAAGGEYTLAMDASVELLQEAEAAGTSVLERHTYLERASELLVRTLAARGVPRDEVRATGRLLLAVRHAHLGSVV